MKGRNTAVIALRVTDEELERLQQAAKKAGKGESPGMYVKRVALREAGRSHKGLKPE